MEMTRLDAERVGLDYFQKLGFTSSVGRLLDYFAARRVLDTIGDSVRFSYVAFREYFAARAAIDDGQFMGLMRGRPYTFGEELVYVTGLQRNNREILEELSSELVAIQARLLADIDLRLFDDLQSSLVPGPAEKEKYVQLLQKSVLASDRKDSMRDDMFASSDGQDRIVLRGEPATERGKLIVLTVLTSQVLRNCELVSDVELKCQVLDLCIEVWARLITVAVLLDEEDGVVALQERMEWPDNSTLDESAKTDRARHVFLITSVLIGVGGASGTLGTDKLMSLVEAAAERNIGMGPSIVAFLSTMLAFDLGSKRRFGLMAKFAKEHPRARLLLEVVRSKLCAFYIGDVVEAGERRKVEGLVADLHVALGGDVSVPGRASVIVRAGVKAGVIADLRKKLLLKGQAG